MRPLNLPAILARAWRQFRDRRGRWFDMAIVPLIWLLALDMMLLPAPAEMAVMTTGTIERGQAMSLVGSVLLYMLLSLIVWAMFAAAWLRDCLAASPRSGAVAGLSWSAPESRVLGGAIRLLLMLLAGFMISVMVLGSSALGGGMTPGGALSIGVVALFGMAPLLARSSLILPAAALGEDSSLGRSWRLTQGNALRLLGLLLVLVVAGYVITFLAGSLAGGILRGLFGAPLTIGPRLVLHLAVNLASFAVSAFVLAALAACYRQLSGGALGAVDPGRAG
ncbi:MAG: hypothetical protein AB7F36_04305 [Reyranellaceae bacterium]